MLRSIDERLGERWELVRPLSGGFQSSVWQVRGADDGRAVLKLLPAGFEGDRIRAAEAAVYAIRRAAYPAPRWLLAGDAGGGAAFVIQDLLPGAPMPAVDLPRAQALVSVLEHQADLDPLPDRCWNDLLAQELGRGLERLRRFVRALGPGGAELVVRCDRLLAAAGEVAPPRRDMVHGDFRPGNVLVDGTTITGVVDVEALGSGTRTIDYATLLDHDDVEPAALEHLVEAGIQPAGPDVLRACTVWSVLDLARFIGRPGHPLAGPARADRLRQLAERVEELERLIARRA